MSLAGMIKHTVLTDSHKTTKRQNEYMCSVSNCIISKSNLIRGLDATTTFQPSIDCKMYVWNTDKLINTIN